MKRTRETYLEQYFTPNYQTIPLGGNEDIQHALIYTLIEYFPTRFQTFASISKYWSIVVMRHPKVMQIRSQINLFQYNRPVFINGTKKDSLEHIGFFFNQLMQVNYHKYF